MGAILSQMRGLARSGSDFVGAFSRYAGWRGVRAGLLLAASSILDGLGTLLVLVPILGLVVETSQGKGGTGWVSGTLRRLGAETPLAQLAWLIGAFVVMSMLRAFTLYARDTALARLQTGFIEDERNRAMRVLASAPWSRVVGLRHARVINLITNEIQRLSSASYFLVQGVVTVAMLVTQTVIAFSLAPALAALVLGLLLLGGLVFVATQGATRELGGGVVKAAQAMMANAQGFLSGLKTAAAQNAQPSFVAEFESIQHQIRTHQLVFQRRQARGRLVFALISSAVGAAVVLVGFGFMRATPTTLLALIYVFARMTGPGMILYQSGQQFVFALPSFESVRALQAELRGDGERAETRAEAPPEGPIELIAAGYMHPGGRGVRDASLTIAPGEFVGIAGPSGAGKTTLVDLIVGLLEPETGEVRIGGVPLTGAVRQGWGQAIAYVSQEGFLFHDSIRRNLRWANPEVTEAEIAAALDFAGASEIVARLDEGLDTVVGERGTLFSGGERQRISLARAMLRKPRLLVLDEAANAIDAPGEAALLDRLKALEPRPTILMISHREESLGWCDRVIRVADGDVIC
ncbi:ABC transporter ATP-binding protein/permease [Sphingomonas sp. LB-2]|uniref:ABC transporter ATP-binding protein n=1 Tax=Sphingomonas caeni TaxID=2984949 RepID=UPI0022325E0E|nr:ABC transporter ATP-binding protein [Sphingomonas caeni]MCW3849578.1 ABC transporter ATP-binding protein/permease [Sphingomonas caeni]